ncbi:CDP-diacylglycerol--glycerol-3-phosphate 3-phosphatidyltransferase [Pyruvatibacter mobilis]|uniref:CDP-diacylglycerol--glycerol-3-phosphate 3-phosphatidyltransferase n=1 Tax=Pyruvatibacter mobilis TaxID=1712261 RepID=UPI003D0D7638
MSSEPRVSSAAATSVAWTLPNILTYARIALVPVLVLTFFIEGNIGRWIAVGIFVAASITDYVDGYIARALKQQSSLGTMLDPIADKLLVAAALLLLAADETIAGISLFAAVIILSREILVSGLREYLASLQVSVPVTQLAKWKTAIQMLAVTFLLCGPEGRELYPFTSELGITLLWVAALLTLYTGYDYFRAGMHHVIAADDRNAQREGDDA